MIHKGDRGAGFFQLVYNIVRQVPEGRVTTYSAVAKFLNNPKGARAVGWAMRQCPYDLSEVPCHRVVNADGHVGGWSGEGGQKRKASLLRREGIKFNQEGIIDLKRFGFANFRYVE
jgi:methylated-DNA-protein-cysteine methyltransferase related protein